MKTWYNAVERCIAEQCLAAYLAANKSQLGKSYRKHRPYSVPELAAAMVRALDNDDEHEGKRLLLIYRTGALSLI